MSKLTHIFEPIIIRKYDIRGIFNETLTEHDAHAVGFAFTHYLVWQRLKPTITVMKDTRSSGIKLKEGLIRGIIEAGGTVVDCNTGTSPMCYFAAHYFKTSGFIMVTGSHNPLSHNGFKFGITGKACSEEEIEQIAQIAKDGVLKKDGGKCIKKDIIAEYIARIMQDYTPPKNLKFGFNALNGAGGIVIKHLAKQMNAIAFEYEMDSTLTTVLDPSNPQNITRMQKDLEKHKLDIIFAFDGDADRIMAITKNKVLYGDDILLLCTKEVLAKEKGSVIFDVKCSNTLSDEISKNGGTPIMYKTGHSLIKKKMLEENAVLAGECSGHIYFKQGYYGFDDGIYTAIRLLSYFAENDFHQVMKTCPQTFKSPEIKISCNNKFETVAKLQEIMQVRNLPFNNIDGIRANFSSSAWFLIRASNTEEILVMRYEAQTQEEYKQVEAFANKLIKEVL